MHCETGRGGEPPVLRSRPPLEPVAVCGVAMVHWLWSVHYPHRSTSPPECRERLKPRLSRISTERLRPGSVKHSLCCSSQAWRCACQ